MLCSSVKLRACTLPRRVRVPTGNHFVRSIASLKKTPLYPLHVARGAKIVPFAGFEMPLQYKGMSVGDSHRWTRQHAGLFDVSHMVQWFVCGENATAFLESITPSSLQELKPMHSTLSVFTNETGGIVDDTIISKHDDKTYYIVTNAACADKDTENLSKNLNKWTKGGVTIDRIEGRALIALQGPEAVAALAKLAVTFDFPSLKFGQSAYIDVLGANCLVSRSGYTGEDGVEMSVPADDSMKIAETLLADSRVQPIGLGARDSLRLEAGMCLYGNDIDDTTSPVEGSLSWVIGKRRRSEGNFVGSSRILKELMGGPSRRRVGFLVQGAPAREGSAVEVDGVSVGRVTSGCPSPSLGKNIAMGYVRTGLHKVGTRVHINVRNKLRPAEVVKMPFVQTHYHK